MAVALDNKKHDVQINDVPYRIRGYQRSELSTFIPRFGSGDQSESEFDLLRSRTIDGVEGGSLQRYFNDEQSVFATEALYPKYDDGILYPVNAVVTSDGLIGGTKAVMTAKCSSNSYQFIASQTFSAPTTSIRRIDSSGTVTTLTLPASLQSAQVTDMVIWNNQLWICSAPNSALWYMSLTATTVNEILAGSGHFTKMVVFRGELYGTDGSFSNSRIYRYTGNTTTRSVSEVADAGRQDPDYNSRLFIYNNRIYLNRKDGMYAYDGVLLVEIEIPDNTAQYNYYLPAVMRGYLYYFMPDGFYRFNGSLIEKLFDVSEIGHPRDVFTGKNRLWFLYPNSSAYGSSRYDKTMGFDHSTGDNVDGRIMCFNGKGMFTYGRTSTWVKNTGTEDFAGQGEIYNGFWWQDKLYVLTWYEKTVGNEYFTIDTDELNATGDTDVTIITSIDDMKFPMIDKSLQNVELLFDGDVSGDDTFDVEYRTSGFEDDTGWTTFGDLTTETNPKTEAWQDSFNGVVYKRVHLKLTATLDAGCGIAKIVTRYLLEPDYKTQWTFTALCYGDADLAPQMNADNTEESTYGVALLRGNIYKARDQETVVSFLDVDYLQLDGALTDVATTATFDDVSILKSHAGFIQIGTEIIRYYRNSGDADNQTYRILRGQLGTTAAAHADNTQGNVFYRVKIRQIQNERIEMVDGEMTDERDRLKDSEITLVVQEV